MIDATNETPEAYLDRVLATWVERLRLSHWDIQIAWGQQLDPSDEVLAECVLEDSYDQARIKIVTTYAEWSQHIANTTIVHELMHVVHRDLDEAVRSAKTCMSASLWGLFEARFIHESEGIVDRLAAILVSFGGIV